MNDFFGSSIQKKAQPMVDFNCNNQRIRNSRKSLFQIFEPKRSSKFLIDNNPADIINANNKINSILSKNLKSIYNENMNDISKDIPIYDIINHLIKNNKKSNKNFKKFFNSKNLSYNLPKDYIRRIRLKDDIFQHVELTNLKKDRLTDLAARNSSKKTAEFGKNFNFTQTPNKKEYKSEIEKEEQVMKKNKSNKRKPILINSKKKYNYSNSLKDYRFFLKSPKISFNTEAFKLDNNPVIYNIIPIEKNQEKVLCQIEKTKIIFYLYNIKN